MVVERERERMAFVAAGYWDIDATFDCLRSGAGEAGTSATDHLRQGYGGGAFDARLAAVGGKRVAQGRDFDQKGRLKNADMVQLTEADARELAASLEGAEFTVASVEEKPYTRRPAAPFMTSTLQQEAGRKLRLSAQQTMRTAQRLYENGYITYMRTDSTTLSESALTAARDQARQLYGADAVPDKPRQYTRKVKNAQEAHEAIRPAGDRFRTPDDVKRELTGEEFRLYDLIWKRTIASQMEDARGQTVSVRIAGGNAEFATAGTVITFRGFLLAYEEGHDEPSVDAEERMLPKLAEGDKVTATKLEPEGHSTSPPARYTEASLVKALEERGIGRPSTYASIMGTILDRGYVRKQGQALVPEFLAFAVINLLEQHFSQLVDYEFTARMEDDLDRIADGEESRTEWLRRFYFGEDGEEGLKRLVEDLGEIDARAINTIDIGDGIELRIGRYGPYLQKGDARQTLPPDIAPDELTVARAEEILASGSQERELGADPETQHAIVVRSGRYGPYVTESLPEGDDSKPRTASLFKSMSPETVTLEEALRLLSLPRTLGESDGEEVVATNGRYGPYVKKGKESRSLESEEQLFTIGLEDALALLAQPKQRGRAAAKPPLKELGNDPVSGKPVVVKEGRFGPYVTDGETNASLRAGDSVEAVTIERAAELLQARRERGPVTKRTRKRK
jgi:DNA topoisomerase-1